MAARRLLLNTMKQICLCAAASFAVRPCPPSPVPFGHVLWGKPCHPHPTWPPSIPIPIPILGLGCVLSILLCPCMTRGGGGGGGHHPPSLPNNPEKLVYSLPLDGVHWTRRAEGSCRGTRWAHWHRSCAWHWAPGWRGPGCKQLPKGDIHFLPPRPQRAPVCRHRLRGEPRAFRAGPVPLCVAPLGWGCVGPLGQQVLTQPQSCTGLGTALCPIYPREAGAIPGDLLSLPTVLTLAWSLPWWGAKQGCEQVQWGHLGRDGAQAPHGCWLCLALGSNPGVGATRQCQLVPKS